MRVVVGGGDPVGLWVALWRLRGAARRWAPLVRENGGPVVLTMTLLGDREA